MMVSKFLLASSIFISLVSIIITVFLVSVVFFFDQQFRMKYLEETEKMKLNEEVLKLIKNLINCLKPEEEYNNVISKSKLDEFSLIYNNLEPRCSVSSDFDYNVRVIQYEKNIRNYPDFHLGKKKVRGGFAEEILIKTNNEKIIFVLDVSGSMSMIDTPPCEGFNSPKNSRICCLKKFVVYFLENYEENTEVGINLFGTSSCGNEWIVNPYKKISKISENERKKVLEKQPEDGTPILSSLLAAVKAAENNTYILLLTDGGENCFGVNLESVVENIKQKNIKLILIGFGLGADVPFLEKLAGMTNGSVYVAKNCEELVGESLKQEEKFVEIERREWFFGIQEKSIGPKIDYKFSLSFPVLIKYNETHIVDGVMVVNVFSGFLERFYSLLDHICSREIDSLEMKKEIYLNYDVKIYRNMICSENVCKKIDCKYEIVEKELKKGENLIRIKVEGGKLIIE